MRWLHALAVSLPLLPGLAAAQSDASLPLKHPARPTTPAITAADLMTRLYVYADDSMQGRETGTIGNVKATDYIAAEARRLGLKPAGDSGTYFQTLPLKTRTFDTASTLAVNGAGLAPYTDYLSLGRASLSLTSVAIVFGGMLGDSVHQIPADQAKGKLVVLRTAGGFSSLRSLRRAPTVPGAAAVALIALDGMPSFFLSTLRRPQTFLDDNTTPTPASTPTLLISSAAAAKMFPGPVDSLAVGAAGGTASVDIRYVIAPAPFPARNVVGIVPGSDPKLKGEYVAIGAHNDHIGLTARPLEHDSIRIWNHVVRPEGADDASKQGSAAQQAQVDSLLAVWRAAHPNSARLDSISNGADDDGSGTVTVLEIAERIATLAQKPRRSILFVWHTGEEKGLLGSRYFTDHPTVPRDSIVAQLNMDMVGRGDAGDETGRTKDGTPLRGSAGYLQLVGSHRLSTELGDLIEQVNKADHHDLTFDYAMDADGHPSNIYCRSDHYEYARYGIPITFFTTGLHSDYHQVTDEPEYIDYAHMTKVGTFVEDVAVHVANLDHRVVVDHPKPDPAGLCRQ
ncbi:MAG TPA: M28 family peptidase [Gemmatimonadales bacterium]|nr:M28 family peptidase [Gemmatimonadales bacterium]